ncbi:MAG: MarR family transcriptional regulator [Hyphomicrobiaceae bacterium]|nr:MarR family transcriptional regulator [Hyphomicrobiaceae bacterium]
MSYDYPWEMPRYRNWIAVGKANLLVKRALASRLATVGLDFPHYEILAAIFRFPGMTQQELADKLLVGRSNLSMLLPELERRGLVARAADKTDKRVRRLSLTAEGEAQAREGLAVQVALIEFMMSALTDEECETIGNLMRKVGRRIEDAGEPGGGS